MRQLDWRNSAAIYDQEGRFLGEARAVGGPFGVSPQETAQEAHRLQRLFMKEAIAELKRIAGTFDLSSVALQLAERKAGSTNGSDENGSGNEETSSPSFHAFVNGFEATLGV